MTLIEIDVLRYAFLLLRKCIFTNPNSIIRFYRYPQLKETFRALLVDVENQTIQQMASESIHEICVKLDKKDLEMSPAFFFVDDFLKNYLDYAIKKTGKHVQCFF